MNIKQMKDKIYTLLGEAPFEDERAILDVIDSAVRKVALYTKCIKKSAETCFVGGSAKLPSDFASFGYIKRGTRIYGRERFEIISGKIKSADIGGACELVYYAYPEAVGTGTDEERTVFDDDYACDTAVYGAAMELCISACPSDVQRYMRIATEYDERMANMLGKSCGGVANGFFGGRGMRI
jgi:hypothetical protein